MIDPNKYASIILYLVSKTQIESNVEYTPREQAAEILNQVLKGSKYTKSATKLLMELSIYNFLMPVKIFWSQVSTNSNVQHTKKWQALVTGAKANFKP